MTGVLDKIRTRGYWEVIIRPAVFIEDRIKTLAECKEIIRNLSVQWRGWDYPHYDYNKPPSNRTDHIEQPFDWENHLEFWRYYQSGQFIHLLAMWEDWEEQRTWSRLDIEPGVALSVLGTLFSFTEIYEFASRLAAKGLSGDTCKISIALHNTKDRKLEMFHASRWLRPDHKSDLQFIPTRSEKPIATAELMAKSAELALDHAIWVFERFNWDNPLRDVFLEDQRKLIEKRL